MFDAAPDGFDSGRRRAPRGEPPVPADAVPIPRRHPKRMNLDSQEMMDLHASLLACYRRELDRQYENRVEQATDEDFYDNIQWTDADAQVVRDRGQLPLVYNVISTSINWVTGTEKRTRMDFKILPRRKDDAKPAERKTALLKYLSDCNRSPFCRSRAFEDAVKVGVGWLECGVEDGDGEPIYDRYESWRNMLWDSAAVDADLTDARYVARTKWVDTDILIAMFPERKRLIEESIDTDNVYATGIEADGDEAMDAFEIANAESGLGRQAHGQERTRNRVIEMWFRKPVSARKMIGGIWSGELFDDSAPFVEEVQAGRSRIERKPMMRVHVAIFTARGLLWFGESPYRHNRFPFTPVWANRRGRDGMAYGMIRGLRDIQTDINKRASKALHILSSSKVIMDEGALSDDVTIDEFADEVARPDAIIVKKAGKELKLDVDRELAPAHLELMSRSIQMIQAQSGVTDELLGRKTNAVSGIAIQRRQDQGSTVTTNLFDHLRYALQVHGEKQLSLVEQFVTEEKSFRITSMRGTPEYVTLNSGEAADDIIRSKADFVISEADWHATLRQAAAETLLGAIKTLPPQVALVVIDLVVENMDLPNREEIVKRIRAVTGLSDPDAEEPSPEQIAAEQAKQRASALQQMMLEADLKTKVATAEKTQAQAEYARGQTACLVAEIKKVLAETVNQGVDAQATAITAALNMLSGGPATASVADQMLREAGFSGEPADLWRQRVARDAMAVDAPRQTPGPMPGPQPAAPALPAPQPGEGASFAAMAPEGGDNQLAPQDAGPA